MLHIKYGLPEVSLAFVILNHLQGVLCIFSKLASFFLFFFLALAERAPLLCGH